MGRWRTCQGRFKMQTLTYCNAKITSTRTAVGQFKGQFNGAMEEISTQGQKVSAPQMPDSSTRWCWSVLLCPRCRVPRPASQNRARNVPLGRWMKVQGKGRRQAHVISPVVIDIAAFKISHSVGSDIDTTALRATRAMSSSMGAMERYTWVRFAGKLTACHRTHIA